MPPKISHIPNPAIEKPTYNKKNDNGKRMKMLSAFPTTFLICAPNAHASFTFTFQLLLSFVCNETKYYGDSKGNILPNLPVLFVSLLLHADETMINGPKRLQCKANKQNGFFS